VFFCISEAKSTFGAGPQYFASYGVVIYTFEFVRCYVGLISLCCHTEWWQNEQTNHLPNACPSKSSHWCLVTTTWAKCSL